MIVKSDDPDYYPSIQELCILCAQDFTDGQPSVMWRGATSHFYVHGGCAGSFVLRLGRDAWQVEHEHKQELTMERDR